MEDYIVSDEKEDLFQSDDFEPPSIIEETPSIVEQTPVIKFRTPIRQKEPVKESPVKNNNNFFVPPTKQKQPIYASPVPDYSDEDDVNKRTGWLINNPADVLYDKEHDNVKESCFEAFRKKFDNLSLNYPDYNIIFPEKKSLNKIHKQYHEHIKNIYVNINLGQTQLCYVLFLMVLEFVFVKAFGLPMSGFTKSELSRMYKYNTLLIEIGESTYSTSYGGTPASLEWRIFSGIAWNVIVFLGVKILSNYIGSEEMSDTIRNLVDGMFDNQINKSTIETGEANNLKDNSMGGLFEGLGGSGDDGSNELISLISNIGTSFTENIEKGKTKKDRRQKKRFIFQN